MMKNSIRGIGQITKEIIPNCYRKLNHSVIIGYKGTMLAERKCKYRKLNGIQIGFITFMGNDYQLTSSGLVPMKF